LLPASDIALEMGNPILANMVLLGALAGIRVLPVDKADFKKVIDTRWAEEQAAQNLQAFALGFQWITRK